MKISRLVAACVMGLAPAAYADTIGSPLIHRSTSDRNAGQVFVYDGITQPFQTTGSITSWAFFDDQNAGLVVTPLLFHIDGNNTFTLAGVGTSVTRRVRVCSHIRLGSFLVRLLLLGAIYVWIYRPGVYKPRRGVDCGHVEQRANFI